MKSSEIYFCWIFPNTKKDIIVIILQQKKLWQGDVIFNEEAYYNRSSQHEKQISKDPELNVLHPSDLLPNDTFVII